MKKYILCNFKLFYYLIFTFTIICLSSLLVLKFLNLFNNITNVFFLPMIIFVFLLLVSNNLNVKNINVGNISTSLNVMLATIFIGDLLFVSTLAFIGGRFVFRNVFN